VDGLETEAVAPAVPRGLRLARLALIPLVAALAAILLLGRGEAAGKTVTTKLGVTTQGRQFKLGLDAKGRPGTFSTELTALCPTGTQISLPWDPSDGDPVPFDRDGDRLHVQERGDGWELELDGRTTESGGMRGTLSLVMHITPSKRPAFDCRSPHVRFSAGV
jgi:hypothetical protein